jgi:hypothetical protein
MITGWKMKLRLAQLPALLTAIMLTAAPAGQAVDPAAFLADDRIELPEPENQSYQLDANLYPTIRPVWLHRVHRHHPSNQLLSGNKLTEVSTDQPSLSNVNVGGDVYNKETKQDLAGNDAKNVIYRIPYEHLTPYVYGGAAYKFESIRPEFSQMGAGAEFRILDNLGIYFDGRYVFTDQAQNSKLARAGFRFSF